MATKAPMFLIFKQLPKTISNFFLKDSVYWESKNFLASRPRFPKHLKAVVSLHINQQLLGTVSVSKEGKWLYYSLFKYSERSVVFLWHQKFSGMLAASLLALFCQKERMFSP